MVCRDATNHKANLLPHTFFELEYQTSRLLAKLRGRQYSPTLTNEATIVCLLAFHIYFLYSACLGRCTTSHLYWTL